MRKVAIFAFIVGASLLALLLVALWYLLAFQQGLGSIGGMMGQMMGTGTTNGMNYSMPSGVWTALVVLIATAVVGVVGLGYFLTFPEIRRETSRPSGQAIVERKGVEEINWAVLMRTSKPDEKKVLSVLAAHDGTYLQKFVVKEAGLSRLKTHRILSRLAERGVVKVRSSGNTNEVSLASWLESDAAKSHPGNESSGP